MTIDELARQAGIAVSTVRLYQGRGLVPPPTKRGRVGWYDDGHLARLRLIAQLQARGFSLAGIKELLDGVDGGESLRGILGLGDDARSTWAGETPEQMTWAELAARLPDVPLDGATVARVVGLGLVAPTEDGAGVVVASPSFVRTGSELASLGLPVEVILDQYEVLAIEAARIAERFTDVFTEHVWAPAVAEGLGAAQVADLVGLLERLGPLAEGVVVTSLRQALQASAERFAASEAARLGIEVTLPSPS